ncbi:hypothetical protein ABZX39_36050 [Streptomyces collinus]
MTAHACTGAVIEPMAARAPGLRVPPALTRESQLRRALTWRGGTRW